MTWAEQEERVEEARSPRHQPGHAPTDTAPGAVTLSLPSMRGSVHRERPVACANNRSPISDLTEVASGKRTEACMSQQVSTLGELLVFSPREPVDAGSPQASPQRHLRHHPSFRDAFGRTSSEEATRYSERHSFDEAQFKGKRRISLDALHSEHAAALAQTPRGAAAPTPRGAPPLHRAGTMTKMSPEVDIAPAHTWAQRPGAHGGLPDGQ